MAQESPSGILVIQTIAMPAHTNANGDIFGGWLLSQMDLGGASLAYRCAHGTRIATVAIDGMSFLRPVHVGDAVCCYASVHKFGRTSIQVDVEAWALDRTGGMRHQVTKGRFTFVAIDKNGQSHAVDWQTP